MKIESENNNKKPVYPVLAKVLVGATATAALTACQQQQQQQGGVLPAPPLMIEKVQK